MAAAARPLALATPAPGETDAGTVHSDGWRSSTPEMGGGGGDGELAFLPQTDLGNVERWERRHGADFRFVPEWGWLAWDGRRWARADALPRMMDSVFATIRAIQDEAAWLAGQSENVNSIVKITPDGRVIRKADVLAGWGRASESRGKIEAVEILARAVVTAAAADFDRHPMALNVLNGTLHFERVEGCSDAAIDLRPHDRGQMITKLAPVEWRERAAAPKWRAFLERVQPDVPTRRFLAAWAGYSLTGDTSEQKFVINHGLGANGKSVWADVLAFVAGDYAATVPIETFLTDGRNKKGDGASPDLARLPGRRFVRTSEPKKGVSFAEELVKLITGQEPMTVRHLHKEFFEFVPEMKITVSANQRPAASSDAAFWRRVLLVPWDVIIPKEERDQNLALKLREEAAGILAWAVDGLLDWMAHGLPLSEAITEATEDYREDKDPLGRFLAECTAPEPGGRIESSVLYAVWVAWARFHGETEWSQKGWSSAMKDKGVKHARSDGAKWLGLRLVKNVADFPDPRSSGGRWDD